MHRVKGLEFDHVFAVAVNKKVLPFGTRADFEDDISLEEFRTGEKWHYVMASDMSLLN